MTPRWQSDDGAIRLYHGDALEVMGSFADNGEGDDDALFQINGDDVDFVFTDPPYGNSNQDGDLQSSIGPATGGKRLSSTRPIANDGAADANRLFQTSLVEYKRLLPPGGCCACCCPGGGGKEPKFATWSL